MGQAIPRQHPAVVLRSHFDHLRALLAVAMVAVVGLTVAVVILATDSDEVSSTSSARPMESIRYDGGPEEGTRGIVPAQQPSARYDGGPEEGTADIARPFAPAAFDANPIESAPGVRYDGGPEEGTALSGSRP